MKIAVVGGKGFIGRPLAAELSKRHEVLVWDLPEVDILNRALLQGELERAKPDVVVNLVGILGGVNSKNVSEIFEVNFWGNMQLLEACRVQGITRYVFASSITVHGENDPASPQTLNAPFRPKHAYGASKAASEFALMEYAKVFGMSAVALRPTMIIGDTLSPHAPIDFITTLLAGKDIEIFGTGEHEREWIWIDDAVQGFAHAVEFVSSVAPGHYPFFLSRNRISMKALAEKCAARLGGRVQYIPREARAFTLTADTAETERVLGWRPAIDIDAMIERLIPIIEKRRV